MGHLRLRFNKNGSIEPKFIITIPKKVSSSAVKRNRARRRIRASMAKGSFPPGEYRILVTSPIEEVSHEILTKEIDALLQGYRL